MVPTVRIGIVGDFDGNRTSHIATCDALDHAAEDLRITVAHNWIATEKLEDDSGLGELKSYDGMWGAPGDPHSSPGIINAIEFARNNDVPYLGT